MKKGNIPKEWNAEVIDYCKKTELGRRIKLGTPVSDLALDRRTANCLWNEEIYYVGDLVQKSESDMLKAPNFGRKSLNALREVLLYMDLSFNMEIPDWPCTYDVDDPTTKNTYGWDWKKRREKKINEHKKAVEEWISDVNHVRKYTLTTPSEYEMKLFLSAREFKRALDEIRDHIRAELKYKELDDKALKILEEIQQKVFEILDETSYFKLDEL